MEEKVFPIIPPKSVIVVDRAPYHTVLTEKSKPASSKFTKQECAKWIVEHKVHFKKLKIADDFVALRRVELAALCQKHKPESKYKIAELAARHGLKIMLLPVAHPELNTIELIWSQLKDYVKKNIDYSLLDVEKYTKEFFDTFDDSKWRKCIDHVKKIEEQYLKVADEIPFDM